MAKKNKKTKQDKKSNGEAQQEPEPDSESRSKRKKMKRKAYEKELDRLQTEMVKLQEWVRREGMRVVFVFEGRDTSGKGGTIKRIMDRLNPRFARLAALGTPTEREKTQWYFQRYAAHLPAAGEIVFFDRSWYNRALVERVMGFCTPDEYEEFMRSCPSFERMLVRSKIRLIKYWLSVSDDEQERRFQERIEDPAKRWKLSPMDLEARARWVDYSKAKDRMMEATDIEEAPWYVADADVQRHARLNIMHHLLSLFPYEDLTPPPLKLPPRQKAGNYVRPPRGAQKTVPEVYP